MDRTIIRKYTLSSKELAEAIECWLKAHDIPTPGVFGDRMHVATSEDGTAEVSWAEHAQVDMATPPAEKEQ